MQGCYFIGFVLQLSNPDTTHVSGFLQALGKTNGLRTETHLFLRVCDLPGKSSAS